MSDRARNRPDSKIATDEWLTPPGLVRSAGPFDLDPCCAPRMPWRTASTMVSLRPQHRRKDDAYDGGFAMVFGDGLARAWAGRVWCNPPYSDILPWVDKMAAHGDGMLLVPAKSTDTKWGQAVLAHAAAILFFKGRLLFHYPNGKRSAGGWGPSMLAAFDSAASGGRNAAALTRVRFTTNDGPYPGAILVNSDHKEHATL